MTKLGTADDKPQKLVQNSRVKIMTIGRNYGSRSAISGFNFKNCVTAQVLTKSTKSTNNHDFQQLKKLEKLREN